MHLLLTRLALTMQHAEQLDYASWQVVMMKAGIMLVKCQRFKHEQQHDGQYCKVIPVWTLEDNQRAMQNLSTLSTLPVDIFWH